VTPKDVLVRYASPGSRIRRGDFRCGISVRLAPRQEDCPREWLALSVELMSRAGTDHTRRG